jgi:hypothetical protein
MRTIIIAAGLLGSSLFRFCDDSNKQPQPQAATSAQVSGATQATAQGAINAKAQGSLQGASVPSLGGSVLAIGAHRAEIAIYRQGAVEGQVTLASGAPLGEPAKAKLFVTVNAEGDARQRVQLRWDSTRERFVGRAAAKAKLVAGPVDIELTVDGKLDKAALANAALLGAPEFGGTVLTAGNYTVELAAKTAGEVEAHVKNAAGANLDGSADLKLKASLSANAGAAREIALNWEGPRAAFTGRAEAGVQLAPGPVAIQLTVGGATHFGGLARLSLAGAASHGGRVLVAGDYSIELAQKDGFLLAYVMDASGAAHAAGDLDLGLRIGADAAGLTRLTWDAPSASYKAKLAANLDLAAQPVRLELKAGGRSFIGAYGNLDAAANAKLDAKAKAEAAVKGDANLAVKAPQLKAKAGLDKQASAQASLKAAAPKVNVTAPKINTSVGKSGSASGSARAGFSFGTK